MKEEIQIRILIAGDWHGNTNAAIHAIKQAKDNGCQHIIQVGDFGMFPAFHSTVMFLDEINIHALQNGVQINALPGNHDDPDWWGYQVRTAPRSTQGFAQVRTNVYLIPRVHNWRWAGKSFTVAGGAASIDDAFRRSHESKYAQVRTLWWPNEIMSDEEVERACIYKSTDYLFTHDASSRSPFPFRLYDHLKSEESRGKVDEVLGATKPNMHWHGHYHASMTWDNLVGETNGEPHYVETYGLNMELDDFSMGVLETDTDGFTLL